MSAVLPLNDNTRESLLIEVEDLIRNAPLKETIRQETLENFAWLGRVSAAIGNWSTAKTIPLGFLLSRLRTMRTSDSIGVFAEIMVLLFEARSDLRMSTIGPVNIAIGLGKYFDYFDGLRKIIETANSDLLFVDPYLNAEFVSRYLSHVRDGVTIRLLGQKKLSTLLPAVEAFIKQHKSTVEVRSSPSFHDRYVFVDRKSCFQSGASFKDGAKNAPTTLTELTDAFPDVHKLYDDLWNNGKKER